MHAVTRSLSAISMAAVLVGSSFVNLASPERDAEPRACTARWKMSESGGYALRDCRVLLWSARPSLRPHIFHLGPLLTSRQVGRESTAELKFDLLGDRYAILSWEAPGMATQSVLLSAALVSEWSLEVSARPERILVGRVLSGQQGLAAAEVSCGAGLQFQVQPGAVTVPALFRGQIVPGEPVAFAALPCIRVMSEVTTGSGHFALVGLDPSLEYGLRATARGQSEAVVLVPSGSSGASVDLHVSAAMALRLTLSSSVAVKDVRLRVDSQRFALDVPAGVTVIHIESCVHEGSAAAIGLGDRQLWEARWSGQHGLNWELVVDLDEVAR